MKTRRPTCLNCKHADVIRYPNDWNKWPIGVYCRLETEQNKTLYDAGADPRDFIHDCGHVCPKWRGKNGDTIESLAAVAAAAAAKKQPELNLNKKDGDTNED